EGGNVGKDGGRRAPGRIAELVQLREAAAAQRAEAAEPAHGEPGQLLSPGRRPERGHRLPPVRAWGPEPRRARRGRRVPPVRAHPAGRVHLAARHHRRAAGRRTGAGVPERRPVLVPRRGASARGQPPGDGASHADPRARPHHAGRAGDVLVRLPRRQPRPARHAGPRARGGRGAAL
ncbi:MAG: hypothetical protein AVDCRST_MAG89-5201, partial [uncultured Gemmatimonadetes bacterium]